MECLIRVPYQHFPAVDSVCQSWNDKINMPGFRRHRKVAGLSRRVILMAQARNNPNLKPGSVKSLAATPVYRVTLCEPETGKWSELPPVPGYPDGLPLFCQLTGIGFDLVLMGGLDPVTWEVANQVFVYNFVSATWRRGADIPGGSRTFFACASDSDRTVFVAGGHDSEKNALRSAMAYDVASDKWAQLPDMASERDECKGVFRRGKFQVIGGYRTDTQGRFERTAEAFDAATWQWDPVQENFLEHATCPRTCLDGDDDRMFVCRDGNVMALDNSTWQAVVELPAEIKCTPYMAVWKGKLLVIGSPRYNEPHGAYLLDLKSYMWTKLEQSEGFPGHVQASCCLEI
ncbi:hypothetical protein RJ639_037772 [Escallonia herrerae]|uniref:Uncharacterized protein n=1 Tax=Escallonia herrerae TaxID=1293975 RepID=A0AA88WWD1_9ASTE|nr:hypothetical protein RJ639_037772 [Escallonia herrerae]